MVGSVLDNADRAMQFRRHYVKVAVTVEIAKSRGAIEPRLGEPT